MRDKVANRGLLVARIAARQHGVVTARQLIDAGLSRNGVSRWVRSERLHRVHQGVYAVGHDGMTPERRWIAAVLACGRGAVVSHRSAAEVWGLLTPVDGPVDISVPGNGGKARRRGIRLHRRTSLAREAVTRRHGIAVTRPAQTIADLRGCVSAGELRRAIRQADVFGLSIGSEVDHDRTRSELERAFLRLCRRCGLPAPEVNVRVGPCLVDFLWSDCNLVVETDGYRYHRGRQAFEDDRARDLELRARGFEVIRLGERQIDKEPGRVMEVLLAALATSRRRVAPDGR